MRIDGFSRIRATLDISKKTGALSDVLCGDAARFARGARLRLELLLVHGQELADPSLIDAARLRILSTDDPDSAIAVNKAIGPSAINAGVTLEEWDAGEPDKCHLRFELTAGEVAEGVFTGTLADASQHWFLLTYGAGEDLLFAGTVGSFDGGYTASGIPPLAGSGASLDDVRSFITAALNNYVKFSGNPKGATIRLDAPVADKRILVGCDDNGDPSFSTQTTT